MMDLNLEGRRAVVTGASLGIGAAAVNELADLGAEVVFCARNEDGVQALAGYARADFCPGCESRSGAGSS